jgi:hypothetical protein
LDGLPDDIIYECGGQYYLATLEDVGGRPAYVEMMKVIKFLLSPLQDKIGWINHTEVKDSLCANISETNLLKE